MSSQVPALPQVYFRCEMLKFAAKGSSAAGDVAVEDSSKKAMRAEVPVFVSGVFKV